jgi:hypothetical protein
MHKINANQEKILVNSSNICMDFVGLFSTKIGQAQQRNILGNLNSL